MPDVIAVAIGEPVVVAWITVLAVRIHHVRGPVQAAYGGILQCRIPGFLAVEQLHGRMARSVTVAGHFVCRLLVDRDHAELFPFVVGEGLIAPIQDEGRILLSLGVPGRMFEDVSRQSVGVNLGIRPGFGWNVFEERAPLFGLYGVSLEPGANYIAGLGIFRGVAPIESDQIVEQQQRSGIVAGVSGGESLAVLDHLVDFAGLGVDAEWPGRVVAVARL